MQTFSQTMEQHGLEPTRGETRTLQVNTGLLCNQACNHCHLEAGPGRKELMDRSTAEDVADYALRSGFEVLDITGGAPEMNPNLPLLLERVAAGARRIMLRANLTALAERLELVELLAELRVVVVASFPALSQSQTDSQRGRGVFQTSLDTLKELNRRGFGQEGSGLELSLVSNPPGAFMPPGQEQAQKRFKELMAAKWGLNFNNLYCFANAPLGRFERWLKKKGLYQAYLGKLAAAFNPNAAELVMCRNLVSVSWEGFLYDCDFNLATDLPMAWEKVHVSQMPGPPPPGQRIAVADHCFTCTAGVGFS